MTTDKHALAFVSIVGSSLEALGALCLAYGREHGPLRTLTRPSIINPPPARG